MASVLPVLLLCLFLQCVASEQLGCMLYNATEGGNFNLTISPEYYQPNKTYYVVIRGNGENLTVALSAFYNNSAFGTWMNKNSDCNGIFQTTNLPVKEMWQSPDNMNIMSPVEFKAYVKMGNMTYIMTESIRSAPMTTAAPMTMKNNMTTVGNNSNMTYASTMKTTAGAITIKPLGGFASVLLLFISIRELLF